MDYYWRYCLKKNTFRLEMMSENFWELCSFSYAFYNGISQILLWEFSSIWDKKYISGTYLFLRKPQKVSIPDMKDCQVLNVYFNEYLLKSHRCRFSVNIFWRFNSAIRDIFENIFFKFYRSYNCRFIRIFLRDCWQEIVTKKCGFFLKIFKWFLEDCC